MDSRELDQRKTLQTKDVVKNVDENDEFEKQRTAAIAEVAKTKEVSSFVYMFCLFTKVSVITSAPSELVFGLKALVPLCSCYVRVLEHLAEVGMRAVIYPPLLPLLEAEIHSSSGDEKTNQSDQMATTENW